MRDNHHRRLSLSVTNFCSSSEVEIENSSFRRKICASKKCSQNCRDHETTTSGYLRPSRSRLFTSALTGWSRLLDLVNRTRPNPLNYFRQAIREPHLRLNSSTDNKSNGPLFWSVTCSSKKFTNAGWVLFADCQGSLNSRHERSFLK